MSDLDWEVADEEFKINSKKKKEIIKTQPRNKYEFKLIDLEHRVNKTQDGKRREAFIEDLERWSNNGKSNNEEKNIAPNNKSEIKCKFCSYNCKKGSIWWSI